MGRLFLVIEATDYDNWFTAVGKSRLNLSSDDQVSKITILLSYSSIQNGGQPFFAGKHFVPHDRNEGLKL